MRPLPPTILDRAEPDELVTPSCRPTVLNCVVCRRVVQGPATRVYRPAPSHPECCGRPMVPVVPEVADPDPASAADPWADRRVSGRRSVRPGTRLEVRAGSRGPDLAVALLDVSATGLRAAVRAPVEPGDCVLVAVGPPDGSWEYRGTGVVRWVAAGAEGTAVVGVRLRTPLPSQSVVDLAEPDTR